MQRLGSRAAEAQSVGDCGAPIMPIPDRSCGKCNWSFSIFECRQVVRMCEVKDENQLGVQQN